MTGLSRQRGLTLIEVMWTLLIISIGTLATLATYSHFADATGTARRQAVLVSVAQREIEQLRPISFDKLALNTWPSAHAATEAPLDGEAAQEPVVTGGVVNPGGDDFTYRGAHGRIYRYVTERTVVCSDLTDKVYSQLASLFTQTLATIQQSVPSSLCGVGSTTKRVTVVVVPVNSDGSTAPGVRLSTVVQDPSGPIPILNTPALALKNVTAPIAATATPSAAAVKQTVWLTDTRCSASARAAPVDHATRDTGQVGYTCSASGPAPTLMTLDPITGAASDPVADFSTDITRAAGGGLAMLRDNQAGSCSDTSNLVYQNGEAATRQLSIHKWASSPASQPVETPVSGGRASLTFWSSTATGVQGPARLCVTLQDSYSGYIYGSTDISLATWPGTATELTTAFDIDHHVLQAGQHLVLTLRVPQDSGNDIRILYDHVSYPSSLSFTTQSGSTLR
jgi:prepilin-type N-terminal cleavage/methylation domain-containing protein